MAQDHPRLCGRAACCRTRVDRTHTPGARRLVFGVGRADAAAKNATTDTHRIGTLKSNPAPQACHHALLGHAAPEPPKSCSQQFPVRAIDIDAETGGKGGGGGSSTQYYLNLRCRPRSWASAGSESDITKPSKRQRDLYERRNIGDGRGLGLAYASGATGRPSGPMEELGPHTGHRPAAIAYAYAPSSRTAGSGATVPAKVRRALQATFGKSAGRRNPADIA